MIKQDEIKEDIIKLFTHDIDSFNIDISGVDIFNAMKLVNIDYESVIAHVYKTIISELYTKYNNL